MRSGFQREIDDSNEIDEENLKIIWNVTSAELDPIWDGLILWFVVGAKPFRAN